MSLQLDKSTYREFIRDTIHTQSRSAFLSNVACPKNCVYILADLNKWGLARRLKQLILELGFYAELVPNCTFGGYTLAIDHPAENLDEVYQLCQKLALEL